MVLKTKTKKEQLTEWGKDAQSMRVSKVSMQLTQIILDNPSGVDKEDLPKILERTKKLVISELDYRNGNTTHQEIPIQKVRKYVGKV
jgi:hypothetical protein